MRSFLLCLSLLSISSAFAQTKTVINPAPPPVLIANEGGVAIAQMVLENTEGTALLKKVHHTGPLITGGKVEVLSQTKETDSEGSLLWTTVTQFTINSLDCLGSDACEGNYTWIATSTVVSTGYTYTTTYTNTVTPNFKRPTETLHR